MKKFVSKKQLRKENAELKEKCKMLRGSEEYYKNLLTLERNRYQIQRFMGFLCISEPEMNLYNEGTPFIDDKKLDYYKRRIACNMAGTLVDKGFINFEIDRQGCCDFTLTGYIDALPPRKNRRV